MTLKSHVQGHVRARPLRAKLKNIDQEPTLAEMAESWSQINPFGINFII